MFMASHVDQSCNDSEICVNSGLNLQNARAYCVKTDLFVNFASGELTKMGYIVPETGSASHPTSAEALLVSQDRGQTVDANLLGLAAFGRSATTGPASSLRELPHGRKICKDCYAVDLEPIPSATKYIKAEVTAELEGSAFLYLVTLS